MSSEKPTPPIPQFVPPPAHTVPRPSSPTGEPVLPLWLGPVLSAAGAAAIAVEVSTAPTELAHKVAGWVLAFCAALGPSLPGWRRRRTR